MISFMEYGYKNGIWIEKVEEIDAIYKWIEHIVHLTYSFQAKLLKSYFGFSCLLQVSFHLLGDAFHLLGITQCYICGNFLHCVEMASLALPLCRKGVNHKDDSPVAYKEIFLIQKNDPVALKTK